MNNLIKSVVQFANDTENDESNYALANEYYNIGHTASALSYYLRCAERTTNKLLAYECMLRVGLCFEVQGNRVNSVRGAYKHAINILPKRPEAYYLLSRINERTNWYIESYMYAEIGLNTIDFSDDAQLRTDVGYPGKYGLIFEKAVSAWWWGKIEECKQLFTDLKYNYVLDKIHLDAVNNNVARLGIDESMYLKPKFALT